MKRTSARILRFLIAAAFLLGVWGWLLELKIDDPVQALWRAVICTLQLFFVNVGFESHPLPWQLMVAGLLAPASLAGAIVLALFTSVRIWLTGVYIRVFVRKPVIVAGSSPNLGVFLSHSARSGKTVVIGDAEAMTTEPGRTGSRPIFLGGSALSSRTWRRAGLGKASAVILFPEVGDEFWQIPQALARACGKNGPKQPISVVLAFTDDGRQDLLASLKNAFPETRNITIATKSLLHSAAADFTDLIAPHVSLGRTMLFQRPVHMVLEGWSPLVREILLEAARQYHYPAEGRLLVTIVQADEKELAEFLAERPGLAKVVDIKSLGARELAACLEGSVPAPWERDPCLVVLAPSSPWDIPRSARRWKRFQGLSGFRFPLLIHAVVQESAAGTAEREALARGCEGLSVQLHVIESFIDWTYLVRNAEVIDTIAERIHARYATLYGAPAWESLTDRERELNRRSARHLKVKLWCMGYRLEEGNGDGITELPDPQPSMKGLLARLEHRRWVAEKLLDDFIPGPAPADPAARTFWKSCLRIHPDLRPFDELNERDVSKDENTFADLRETLRLLKPVYRVVKDEDPETQPGR